MVTLQRPGIRGVHLDDVEVDNRQVFESTESSVEAVNAVLNMDELVGLLGFVVHGRHSDLPGACERSE